MFRMMVMNGLLISLICIWTSAAREPTVGRLNKSPVELPTGPLTNSLSEPQVSLNEHPMETRRRKNSCRRELDGKCVRRNKRCPSSLPLEKSPGRPYCSKRRRCCYPDTDTSCQFRSLQERKEYLKLWPGRCDAEDDDCKLDWTKGSPTYPPLMLHSTGQILLPKGKKGKAKINIENGKKVIFACSQSKLENFNGNNIEGICEKGELLINGEKKQLADMGCTEFIGSSVIKKTSSVTSNPDQDRCGYVGAGRVWLIGFETYQTPPKNFYTLIEVCFEEDEQTTLSTKNMLHGESFSARDGKIKPPSWAITEQFTVDMPEIYTEKKEKKLFEEVLDGILSIDWLANKFFSKGHLSPRSDFITGDGQYASYYYLNALPQWQKYNGGNWGIVEGLIQNLAEKNNALLDIYTGGSGVMKTPKGKKIFLVQSIDQEQNTVPIPNLIWKVVTVNSKEGVITKAVAFVTNNNPLEGKGKPEEPCKDVCADLSAWISKEKRDLLRNEESGYTYCCNVADLNKEDFPNLPKIDQDVPLLKDLK